MTQLVDKTMEFVIFLKHILYFNWKLQITVPEYDYVPFFFPNCWRQKLIFCSDRTNTFYEPEDNKVALIRYTSCAHIWDPLNDGVSSFGRSLVAWRRFLRAKFSLETTQHCNRYVQKKKVPFLKTIPRLRKSHVFTMESENVQSEDKAQLKPDAGGLERSSPFPFKLKEGFRNLWKELAVRFDGRHCGMRTLSIRRLPPVSSKPVWRFGLSSVADCPAVSWWPPGIQAPVLKRAATDLQTEQTKLRMDPVCRTSGGILGVQEVLSGLSCRWAACPAGANKHSCIFHGHRRHVSPIC